MKKYIVIILLIGIITGTALIYNIIKAQKSNEQIFDESGYILQSADQNKQTVDRFYFKANSVYKKNYSGNIEFSNTDGEKVETNNENFIHYSNGSIGAFKNGVLLNLNEVNDKLLTYYNISKKQILTRKNNTYSIPHLGNELFFTSLLWKISDTKYLIASDNITLSLGNGEDNKFIKGYVEIEYQDNEIIKIYNQEISFLTISPEAFIDLKGDIRVNLSNKLVSYKGENKLSMDSMVIDSEDNVTIADLSQDENTNQIQQNTVTTENAIQNNTTVETASNPENGGNGENGGVTVIVNDGGDSGSQATSAIINQGSIANPTIAQSELPEEEEEEEIVDNTKKINSPEYKVTAFESSSVGIKASISIDDKDALLTDDSLIEIVEQESGRKVYTSSTSAGVYDFDVETTDLTPNTDYTMTISSSYKIEEINYNKNFIYKTFKTKPIGLSISKDVFTENSISVNVEYEKNTLATATDVQLFDSNGNLIETKRSNISENLNDTIEFTELTPNTNYKVALTNVTYDGQIIGSGYIAEQEVQTLKQKPTISNTEFEIDKRNSTFNLQLKNVVDLNSGITGYRFEIFNVANISAGPVMSINTEKNEVIANVDDETLYRNIGYVYRVVATFYDNEKIIEYESEYSDVMKLDGAEFPSLSWREEEVTFEKIKGIISIEDSENTVSIKHGDTIKVIYKDSLGEERTITTEGALSIPIDVNNLRKNETYKFSVYGKVDLHDGNDPVEECLIGSILVKTKEPTNMLATFSDKKEDVNKTFSINFNLSKENLSQGELEPQTLTGMTMSIYAGQTVDGNIPTGIPIKTVKLVDANPNPYESDLKENYYDNTFNITPETFSAKNNDFRDKYYTIVVGNAYDYTDYKNSLPILKNVYTFETNGYMPDYPADVNNALDVSVIRNRDSGNPREDLEASTIVGYKVTADYNNTDKTARKIIYKMYNANSNELVKTIEIDVSKDSYEIPSAIFEINDGVKEEENDNQLPRRGNSYYFRYEAKICLKPGEEEERIDYPVEDSVIFKSRTVKAEKQEAGIRMYPLNSNQNTYTIAYKIADIDNIIYDDNLKAFVNGRQRDFKQIEKNKNTFNTVTFENLSNGNLEIVANEQKLFNEEKKDRVCINNYFEGINTIADLKFDTELDDNKVNIKLHNASGELENVVAYKIVLTSGNETITKDMLISKDNVISLKYSSIKELKGKDIKMQVYGYYDTGITGYNLETDKYVTYLKPYTTDAETIYHYQIDENNKFINSPGNMGNIYSSIRQDNNLVITNQIDTSKRASIELTLTDQGFEYDGDVVLQKQIGLDEIKCSNTSNVFRFDNVTTEISVKNSEGKNDIDAELTTASFYAQLNMAETIYDGKIQIEVYVTDENGKTATLAKTIEKDVADFNNKIEITDLLPKTYYFLQFKARYEQGQQIVSKYLYDSDYDLSGKQYFFSTLANIEIKDLSASYVAEAYDNKSIKISYSLDKIMGYSQINYKLQRKNEQTGQFEDFGIQVTPDILFKNNMEKKIAFNPEENPKFKFGELYKITVTPTVEHNGEIYEVGKQELEFRIDEPRKPLAVIKLSSDKSRCRVTVYDRDYVIPTQKYTIRITKNGSEDVTPEEYKNTEYSISKLNKSFELGELDETASYKFEVITNIDIQNNTHTQEYIKYKEIKPISDDDISVGTILTQTNLQEGIYKIKLLFNESQNLTKVTQVKYTIYNELGYSQSIIDSEFKPTLEKGQNEENYYTYVLDNNMNGLGNGVYYIEMQFYKNNTLVDDCTLEHLFII